MTGPTILGVQLDGRKVLDIVPIEKHVPHSGSLLVHLERMPGEDDPLGDDPGRIGAHERPHGHQMRA